MKGGKLYKMCFGAVPKRPPGRSEKGIAGMGQNWTGASNHYDRLACAHMCST